jgi:ubiquinone biosynthesis protein Coq4
VGAGNAALAHHDWVHLLAGYDTTPIGELEVTAFMAAASGSRGAMLGFLGAVSIYETGLLRSVVLGVDYAHTLTAPGALERVAAAIQRGAACRVDPLRDVEYFALADQPLAQIRRDWGLEAVESPA